MRFSIDLSKGLQGTKAVAPVFMQVFGFCFAGALIAIYLIDGEVSFSNIIVVIKGLGASIAVGYAAIFLTYGIRAK